MGEGRPGRAVGSISWAQEVAVQPMLLRNWKFSWLRLPFAMPANRSALGERGAKRLLMSEALSSSERPLRFLRTRSTWQHADWQIGRLALQHGEGNAWYHAQCCRAWLCLNLNHRGILPHGTSGRGTAASSPSRWRQPPQSSVAMAWSLQARLAKAWVPGPVRRPLERSHAQRLSLLSAYLG